jgi:hypothetical protein
MVRIRPEWQAKNLIERVRRLLPVDPSSACQRLFNAAIRDLRDKILIVGVGIAGEAAKTAKPRLPSIESPEDIENYSMAHLIKLAHQIGLLSRAEWRKMTRVYDIRKDLEHEDAEYEAAFGDVVYIFATCALTPCSRRTRSPCRGLGGSAASAFLDWLEARGLTLAGCTQVELDQWLAGTSSHLARSANFVRWAVARRHASGLTAPATRWAGPSGPLDQDRRWADARRLLHDETYPAADCVAGLLILLYAQKLNVITVLTTRHVLHEDGRTLLRLGSRPIVLPPRWTPSLPGSRTAAGLTAAACSASLPPGCSPVSGQDAR